MDRFKWRGKTFCSMTIFVGATLSPQPAVYATDYLMLGNLTTQPAAEVADYVLLENTEADQEVELQAAFEEYWTPDRLNQAEEFPLPEPAGGFFMQATLEDIELMSGDREEATVKAEGQLPTVEIEPELDTFLFEFDDAEGLDDGLPLLSEIDDASSLEPQDYGSLQAHFTSSRITPFWADSAYPYLTVGKLFFTVPGRGDSWCSAAVIKPRVILTAGHCVHSGAQSPGFYQNWRFIPSYRNGQAPFQTWNWSTVSVTRDWAAGGGRVPNAADYAVIVLQDRVFNSTPRRIGEITGWLGFHTQRLHPNHAHLLGYPGNFDSGNMMHQVTAESFRAVQSNNVEYGSDMRGGSSGGPYVHNFGLPAVGQTGGENPGRNRVIGVVSYGYVSSDPKVQGSSILDSRFLSILNAACSQKAGNC